jgi:hypothetical protein
MTMSRIYKPTALFALAAAVIATLGAAVAAHAAPRQGPCAEIRAACEQAGFVPGGGRGGIGLAVDCVAPIMQAKAQRPKASKPLPSIEPQLVEACRARNPNFGQRKAQLPLQAPQPPQVAAPPQAQEPPPAAGR